MNLQERLNGYVDSANPPKAKRNKEDYAVTQNFVERRVTAALENYWDSAVTNKQEKRLIRDEIDRHLRRYHGYCIEERWGAHYFEKGLGKKDGVFEHLIPLKTVRDLLLARRITVWEACNMPTCRVCKTSDLALRQNKMVSITPNIYNFWLRYEQCFPVTGNFVSHDGKEVNVNMTLQEHFDWLKSL